MPISPSAAAPRRGHAGQTHQQPGRHIGCLGTHCGDQGAHAAAAQIKAFGALLASTADHDAGKDHEAQVQDDGAHDKDLRGCHS